MYIFQEIHNMRYVQSEKYASTLRLRAHIHPFISKSECDVNTTS